MTIMFSPTSQGALTREEYNLPLAKESYEHQKEKVDGRIIHKTRYVIPMSCVCPENADFCSTPLFSRTRHFP